MSIEHPESCGEECCCGGKDQYDVDTIQQRVTELEALSTRTLEQNEELADRYVDLAAFAFGEGEDLDVVIDRFAKAEAVLKAVLTLGEDTEIRRRLGNVYLHQAVTYNDYDELDRAVEAYGRTIETLKPLEDAGDGEAKYDIAGAKLNRGTIYHEIGEMEKAKTDLDESFMSFRAVEKISDLDTRYYMAKVSVAQGSLLRDMDEPLDKVVDAYNRAMRLLVELIDIGHLEHERDLANVLMDRCVATYEDCKHRDFESETERRNKIDDVLVDVGRAIEILERLVDTGDEESNVDLFNALTTQGSMLFELEKYPEAKQVFDRAIDDFGDVVEEMDPMLLDQYASTYENRAFCLLKMDRCDDAIKDFDESIRLAEIIQGDDYDLDIEERKLFLPTLATYYANRANGHSDRGDKDAAQADCRKGLEIIQSLKSEFGNELDEIETLFKSLIERLQ